MSWQDIERDLLGAFDARDQRPVLGAADSSARIARWVEEHFVPKLTLRREDIVILPMDPVSRDHARLETLLAENAEIIASFAKDAESAVRIVAMMIGMDGARCA